MAGVEIFADRLPKHRRTWTVAALILSFIFMLMSLIPILLLMFIDADLKMSDLHSWQGTSLILALFMFWSILVILWVTAFERKSLGDMGLNGRFFIRYGRGLLFGFLLILMLLGAFFALEYGADYFTDYNMGNTSSFEISAKPYYPLVILFFATMIQAGTEELVFRGWLLPLIASRHGIWASLLITNLIFCLLHINIDDLVSSPYISIVDLGVIFLIGVLLSLYAIKEGSIWGVCAFHTVWNWLQISVFYLFDKPLDITSKPLPKTDFIIDTPFGALGVDLNVMASLITLFVFLGLVLWFLSQKAHRSRHGYGVVGGEIN